MDSGSISPTRPPNKIVRLTREIYPPHHYGSTRGHTGGATLGELNAHLIWLDIQVSTIRNRVHEGARDMEDQNHSDFLMPQIYVMQLYSSHTFYKTSGF